MKGRSQNFVISPCRADHVLVVLLGPHHLPEQQRQQHHTHVGSHLGTHGDLVHITRVATAGASRAARWHPKPPTYSMQARQLSQQAWRAATSHLLRATMRCNHVCCGLVELLAAGCAKLLRQLPQRVLPRVGLQRNDTAEHQVHTWQQQQQRQQSTHSSSSAHRLQPHTKLTHEHQCSAAVAHCCTSGATYAVSTAVAASHASHARTTCSYKHSPASPACIRHTNSLPNM